MRYRKKPDVVEAIRLPTLGNWKQDRHLFLEWGRNHGLGGNISMDEASGTLLIHTLEGDMRADPGDWLIKGVTGEFYPCKPHIFEAAYEREDL